MSDPVCLFAYGELRKGRQGHALLAQALLERREARAPGEMRRGRLPFPYARFEPNSDLAVPGELFILKPEVAEAVLAELDDFEGPSFERVRIRVLLRQEQEVDAWAYQWTGPLDEPHEYLTAARNKVKVAEYHLERLSELQQDDERVRIPLQAHLEGILYSAAAAADQLADALNLFLGLGMRMVGVELLFERLAGSTAGALGDFARCVNAFRRWAASPQVSDARELRRRATHHYYDKLHTGERAWMLEEVEVRGEVSAYEGSREVLEYSRRLVGELQALIPVLDCAEQAAERGADERWGESRTM